MAKDFKSSPFDASRDKTGSSGRSGLAPQLMGAGHFLSRLGTQLRFGHLTRAPLQLVRLEIADGAAVCEWIARVPDPWDAGLPRDIGRRHASLQALRDAIDIRNLLFHTLPQIDTASLRGYRHTGRHSSRAQEKHLELILTGEAERSDRVRRSVRSLAMRANLLGFRFSLVDDMLERLHPDDLRRVGT